MTTPLRFGIGVTRSFWLACSGSRATALWLVYLRRSSRFTARRESIAWPVGRRRGFFQSVDNSELKPARQLSKEKQGMRSDTSYCVEG